MTEPYFSPAELLTAPTARAAYSDRTAWIMAKMSQLAYDRFEDDDKASLCEKLESGGFELVATFNVESEKVVAHTQAFLAVKEDLMAVLAFRGTTANFKQILTDLDAKWIKTSDGRLHKGFEEAYEIVEEQITAAVGELPDGIPLYITGHSLGGAVATVSAMHLEELLPIAACYTFGSPRVGSPEWADGVKCPVYRTVNAADGVPLVPFSVLLAPFLFWIARIGFIGFQHVGDMRFLTADGKLKIGAAAFFRRFIRVTTTIIFGIMKFDFKRLTFFVRDHSIEKYVEKLEKYAVCRQKKK